MCVFLTGYTSAVGRALALYLAVGLCTLVCSALCGSEWRRSFQRRATFTSTQTPLSAGSMEPWPVKLGAPQREGRDEVQDRSRNLVFPIPPKVESVQATRATDVLDGSWTPIRLTTTALPQARLGPWCPFFLLRCLAEYEHCQCSRQHESSGVTRERMLSGLHAVFCGSVTFLGNSSRAHPDSLQQPDVCSAAWRRHGARAWSSFSRQRSVSFARHCEMTQRHLAHSSCSEEGFPLMNAAR